MRDEEEVSPRLYSRPRYTVFDGSLSLNPRTMVIKRRNGIKEKRERERKNG